MGNEWMIAIYQRERPLTPLRCVRGSDYNAAVWSSSWRTFCVRWSGVNGFCR